MKLRCALTTCLLLAITFLTSHAQDFNGNDSKWIKGWTNFTPNTTNYPEADEKLPNIIAEDTYLNNDKVYLLSGDVYVTGNAILTIQEGTVIRGDHENPANLIITRGSKLIAVGSEAYPIVFTSNKAPKSRASGDWGGIIIAGSGKVNSVSGNGVIKGNFNPQYSVYGGNDQDEQTAILRFVRIEFPGNKSKRIKNSNGLSLFGIGTASIIDHVMVSYSGQDSFNWTGGNNNMRNMLSYKAEDDDFQISEGFKGDLDYLMAIRHPYINSPKGSYAIEIDGYDKNSGYLKPNAITDVTITNSTFVNLSDNTNYIHTSSAISAKNSALVYLHNSKISGFLNVVKFDDSYTSLAVIERAFKMDNSFFNIHGEGVEVSYKPSNGVMNVLKYNRFTKDFVSVDNLFEDPTSKSAPKFQLKKAMNNYMVMQ
ncbi:hypothetical protein D1818_11205 [Aquimarina sp. BL5]|uniref:hypothetical protein n=1 Tax=Aquimarina sp. BL5 TaxID=1714860 RepID=UPI000E477CB2|nr:hypothetical protein [Aquimarina sp. BL5]AXT51370.1 hypothetical protein D1818_11205 [Aquimarina sp. BL5]RKN05470.1 hypothetical protein D7036_10515 [Aquimarina sp. BL5]